MEELMKLLRDQESAFGAFRKDIDARIRDLETRAARRPMGRGTDLGHDDLPQELSEHSKLFGRYLRKGIVDGLAELQQKAMSVGSDPDGGYAVPEDLQRRVEKVELANSPMRGIVRVEKGANDSHEILVSQRGAGASWVGETAARTETATPTLASVKPPAGEIYANPKASQKLLDDAMFDAGAWLADEIGATFGASENAAIVNGDGTNKPKGVLQYTISATPTFGQIKLVKSGTSGVVTADSLLDAVFTLRPVYRRNASWVMNAATLAAIRKLKSSGGGDYLFQAGLVAGQPDRLLGYPVVECEDMPVPGASSNSIAFADWKRFYALVDIGPTRLLRDPYTAKPHVHYYTTKRVAGGLLDSTAGLVYQLAA